MCSKTYPTYILRLPQLQSERSGVARETSLNPSVQYHHPHWLGHTRMNEQSWSHGQAFPQSTQPPVAHQNLENGVVPFQSWSHPSSQQKTINRQNLRSDPARFRQTEVNKPRLSRPSPSVHWSGVGREGPNGQSSFTSENWRGTTPAYGGEDLDGRRERQWHQINPLGWGFSSYCFPADNTTQKQLYPNSFGIGSHDQRGPFALSPGSASQQQQRNVGELKLLKAPTRGFTLGIMGS